MLNPYGKKDVRGIHFDNQDRFEKIMEDYAKYLVDKKLIYGYDYDDKTFLKFDLNEKGPTSKYFLTLLENKLLGI